jgi:hypothetical protein
MAVSASFPLGDDILKKPPMAIPGTTVVETPLIVTISIDDPEVAVELRKREEGYARNAFAASALRIGALALRQAQGNVDAEIVRNEGQRLISDLGHELSLRFGEMNGAISSSLKQYFDPQSGHFTERVERLIKKDGDLERVLRQQIGDGENSELARALARRIGDNSILMRRLNPEDAEGITRSIENSVKDVLDAEQRRVLNEFSLDNDNGALSRVVTQLRSANQEFKGDIQEQIKNTLQEFSLDNENSAISRLVKKVDAAKDEIADQFSVDNKDSAINKLNRVLADTRQSINDNLTLDSDQSALARLKKQLTDVLEDIRDKNQRFQEDVSAKLASLITKHQEEMRATTHGLSFEEEFCAFLQAEAQKAGDVFTATGSTPGVIPKCKTGDAVIELGAEAAAAGERIVFEAKSNKSYTLNAARAEIEEARKNREANVGVFVFAKSSAPAGMQPLMRIDRDLFVIWDASDTATDIYLTAAVSVAKALLFRQTAAANKSQGEVQEIERAVNILENQLGGLDEMETWTNTIQSNGGKIIKKIAAIRDGAQEQIDQLRASTAALKTGK